jgi:HlyD family secretion protein
MTMAKQTTGWKWAIAILLLAVGGWFVYRSMQPQLLVDAALVDRGPMEAWIDEDGKTRLQDRYIVSAPLSGNLVRIQLREGDPVEAGKTTLATIHPAAPGLLDVRERRQAEARRTAASLAVDQSRSRSSAVRESLELAGKTLERLNYLKERDSTSQQDVDIAQAEFQSLKAQLSVATIAEAIAKFELEQVEAALLHVESDAIPQDQTLGLQGEDFHIVAPIDGRVLRVLQESQAVVQPGDALLEIGDPRRLEIEIDVLSPDAVKIRAGDPVRITGWGGDQPLNGRVRLVEPAATTKISSLGVEEQRVNVVVDIEEPPENRETLGDAFRVDARIIYWQSKDVLRVPSSALLRVSEGWAVYRIEGNRALRTPIQIGHRNPRWTEVLEGLSAGQQVIEYPSDKISSGVLVTPKPAS